MTDIQAQQKENASTMIERVARRLSKQAWERFHHHDGGFAMMKYPNGVEQYADEQWLLYVADARAAIDAMREPTEAMTLAGLNCDAWANAEGNAVEMLSGTFTAMIDSALKGDGK